MLYEVITLSDELVKSGNLEKTSLAIQLTATFKDQFTKETFHHIGTWFTLGFNNWASVDVLCMLVLPHFITQNIITLEELKAWNNAEYEWQRRCVPVTLNELRKTITPSEVFSTIEPIMPDGSEYVQKGIGTLLRTIWKNHPNEVEEFLLKYKDDCGRLIIQYATEKMDKEYRKMFRKTKKQ